MYDTNAEAIDVITWGCRLLYVALGIISIPALTLWYAPITIPYMGAIVVLIVLARSIVNNEAAWEEYEIIWLEHFLEAI